ARDVSRRAELPREGPGARPQSDRGLLRPGARALVCEGAGICERGVAPGSCRESVCAVGEAMSGAAGGSRAWRYAAALASVLAACPAEGAQAQRGAHSVTVGDVTVAAGPSDADLA